MSLKLAGYQFQPEPVLLRTQDRPDRDSEYRVYNEMPSPDAVLVMLIHY